MSNEVTKTITDENQFTDWISPKKNLTPGLPAKRLNFSIKDNSTKILISVQRTFNAGVTTYDVPTTAWNEKTYDEDTEQYITDKEECVQYRVGCKTSGFTSGSCTVRLGA